MPMSTPNTQATLDALWKEIYADKVENLMPESAILQRAVPFGTAEKVGDKFIQPVLLSGEHGVTYLGINAGVEDLETSVAAVFKEAQVDPSSVLLRSSISYNAADKMASSKEAFENWSEMLVTNMSESFAKRNEIAMLYGQTNVGVVGAVDDTSGTNVLTIADFTDGIWAGMEGARLDAYNGNARRNTNAALVVDSVDFEAQKVTVTGNSTDTAAIAQGDFLNFRLAKHVSNGSYKEMAGLDRIITNTGSLFNINAGDYGLWKGHSISAGSAALTLGKIFAGHSRAAALGFAGEMHILLNPRTYAGLNTSESALRSYDSSYKYSKNESGSEELCFYSGVGKLVVKQHIYCKPTEAFGVPMKHLKRIGTTDITFKLNRAAAGGEVFLHIPDKSGYEIRCRSEQALFLKKPAHGIKWHSIVNPTT